MPQKQPPASVATSWCASAGCLLVASPPAVPRTAGVGGACDQARPTALSASAATTTASLGEESFIAIDTLRVPWDALDCFRLQPRPLRSRSGISGTQSAPHGDAGSGAGAGRCRTALVGVMNSGLPS